MRFHLTPKPGGLGARARLLDDSGAPLLDVSAQEDEVLSWCEGMARGRLNGRELNALLERIDRFHQCEVESRARQTFWRVKCALLKYLQVMSAKSVHTPDAKVRAAQRLLYLVLAGDFNFQAMPGKPKYSYAVVVSGKKILSGRPTMLGDSPPDCVPQETWAVSLLMLLKTDDGERKVRELLMRHSLLANVARDSFLLEEVGPAEHEFTWRSFISFSKALVKFVDQQEGLVNLRPLVPSICSLIVEHECESADEQRFYLQRLLQHDEAPKKKFARLERIVEKVDRAALADPSKNAPRLGSIVGTISTHYLRQYDLNTAVHFWRIMDRREKDWVLRSLLSVYNRPGLYAAAATVFMAALTALTALQPSRAAGGGRGLAAWLPHAMILSLYTLALLPLAFVIKRFFLPPRRGLEYIELTLPSLLGTIVVGLSALLLQDYAWKLGLGLTAASLVLTSLTVYTLSFVYIFIDVHKTIRFSPPPPPLPPARPGLLRRFAGPLGRGPNPETAQTMRRSIGVSYKIFLIGLLEAFVAVVLTTGLFSKALMTEEAYGEVSAQVARGDLLVLEWAVPWVGTLMFFPGLVLLWTGLTLFIGAFAQLVWQDRRITSPL